jgi:DNA-binding beta-propeller fold protein YncE
VLDATTNRLVWLPPTATGYDRIVYNYLSAGQTADFTTAVAMAVDSNIYVLSKNGTINRFYGGKAQTFDLATPDIPLKLPTALVVGEETKNLYVLDSGNERVVAFSADGHFRRQIRSIGAEHPFRNATSLAVDESKNRLYVLSGKIVYSIELE